MYVPLEHRYHYNQVLKFMADAGLLPEHESENVAIPEELTPMFMAAIRATSEMTRLQIMDIESIGFKHYQTNRMVLVERGTPLKEVRFIPHIHRRWQDAGTQKKSTVYWLSYGYDTKEANELWVQQRGKENLDIYDRQRLIEEGSVYLNSDQYRSTSSNWSE